MLINFTILSESIARIRFSAQKEDATLSCILANRQTYKILIVRGRTDTEITQTLGINVQIENVLRRMIKDFDYYNKRTNK